MLHLLLQIKPIVLKSVDLLGDWRKALMETASFCSENSLTKSVSTKPRKFKESFSLFDHSDKKKKELYTAIPLYRCKSRSNHRRCSVKNGVLRNFAKFAGKHLCQSLFLNKVAGLRPAILLKKRLWHSSFLLHLAKISKSTSFYRTPLGDCFCKSQSLSSIHS